MAESIKLELEDLERTGRVTARDHRPVHGEFDFTAIPEAAGDADEPVPVGAPSDIATGLDDAWSRLKQRIAPE